MNASGATGDLWLIRAGGQDHGPYTVEQIKGFINEGRVQAQTEIAAAGGAIWTTVAALPVFAALFAPAAPPVSHVRPPAPGAAAPAGAARADFLIRAAAILVDGVILLVAQLVIGGILAVIVGDLLSSLAMLVAAVAYFVVLHSKQPDQATIGKRLMGLRLVRDDGQPVSPKLALGRYGAALLSGMIFGIGYLLPLFRDDRKTLHDILCNTHVVRLKK